MFEKLAFKTLTWLATTYPMMGLVVLSLGVVFIGCELFVKATPKKTDDKKWANFKSGYLGPLIGFCMGYVKQFFTKK